MAPFPGKRKRVEIAEHKVKMSKAPKAAEAADHAVPAQTKPKVVTAKASTVTVQVITGDYDKITHGLAAKIPADALTSTSLKSDVAKTTFSETFLLAAHTAAIRCLAVSPRAEGNKRYLATGSADERINVYSLSTSVADLPQTSSAGPTLNGTVIAENSNNRSLGRLMHHDRAISRLCFPTKGKLFSSAEDNTIAISRTRDWTMLSSIKAPIPKVQGRPSGDTAAPGEVPTGINDFAIHPSQKLMLSVSRGEKCMRLWNLMTGKKAGVLNFDRELLMQVGEGKHSSGEGRRVLWDGEGQHYIVGFERGAALFGIDSKPRALCKATPLSKLHHYSAVPSLKADKSDRIAISTEDGRILFYDAKVDDEAEVDTAALPQLKCIAQVGGKSASVTSRIKVFTLLPTPTQTGWIVVAAGSDGTIWLWLVNAKDLDAAAESKQIGSLIAVHKSQSRITCLAAFLMDDA